MKRIRKYFSCACAAFDACRVVSASQAVYGALRAAQVFAEEAKQ